MRKIFAILAIAFAVHLLGLAGASDTGLLAASEVWRYCVIDCAGVLTCARVAQPPRRKRRTR